MEKAINIAQYICTEYTNLSGNAIDEMKLHKLLYLTQRESIAITGEPMFSDEFEGWKFGPVCPSVRYSFYEGKILSDETNEISLESAYIAKNILLQYGAYESWKLSELSHKELSWRNSRKGLSDGQNGHQTLLLDDIKKDAEKVRPYDSIWDMYYDEFEDAEEM